MDNGLIDENVDDLEYLTVQGANGSYTVRSSDDLEEGASFAYTMDGYDDLPLDRYTIRTAVSTFTNATYLDVVFEDTTGMVFVHLRFDHPHHYCDRFLMGEECTPCTSAALLPGITGQYCMLEGGSGSVCSGQFPFHHAGR